MVFFGSTPRQPNGGLYALEAETGRGLWTYPIWDLTSRPTYVEQPRQKLLYSANDGEGEELLRVPLLIGPAHVYRHVHVCPSIV
jgi:outer membrane protein assembly factor BamB